MFKINAKNCKLKRFFCRNCHPVVRSNWKLCLLIFGFELQGHLLILNFSLCCLYNILKILVHIEPDVFIFKFSLWEII